MFEDTFDLKNYNAKIDSKSFDIEGLNKNFEVLYLLCIILTV